MQERDFHLILVRRISFQNFILSDQTLGALGEKYFVAEFLRGEGLAALDQVGVGFEDGKQFLRLGNLLPFQHATASLIEDAFSQLAIVRDLLAELLQQGLVKHIPDACIFGLVQYGVCAPHYLLGDLDQLTVFPGESSFRSEVVMRWICW